MLLHRVTSEHPGYLALIAQFDTELRATYPTQESDYDQHNVFETPIPILIGLVDKEVIACGGYQPILPKGIAEVKRMYVHQAHRRQGYAQQILEGLEKWITEEGYTHIRLETGTEQHAAMALYTANGFEVIPCYPPYDQLSASRCYEKVLA